MPKPTREETCLTIEVDGKTRCTNAPEKGTPRCIMHQKQYRTMYKRYKDASKIVDEMETAKIPIRAQIVLYEDLEFTKKKAIWVRRYVEAIRVEKIGREVHQTRFFLKVDRGHKIRGKLLERKMVESINAMDALEERVFDLQYAKDPAYVWVKKLQSETRNLDSIPEADQTADSLSLSNVIRRSNGGGEQAVVMQVEENEDDDPIELVMRAEKRKYLRQYGFLRESREEWMEHSLSDEQRKDAEYVRSVSIQRDTILQYTRRIILHDPVLTLKAEGKVSLNDLFLDTNFSAADFEKLEQGQREALGAGMIWWKDATLDAIAMWPAAGKKATNANLGDLKNRFKIVGGWVFNGRHSRTMTNEAWWYLLNALRPPANVENRFMYLCNNFDDLKAFLSFGALKMYPPPTFCQKFDSGGYRAHLSLCGVVVGDVVQVPPEPAGPLPTSRPASRPGLIQWAQLESRNYMFGAVRDDADAFTHAFLRELRLHPDKFVVITRLETDPGQQLELFGGAADETFYQMRMRTFEAPKAELWNRPVGRGAWDIPRSGRDVLFCTGDSKQFPYNFIKGYLTELTTERNGGWLFWLKKDRFKVKYFLIMDPVLGEKADKLFRDVAWAALCAAGYARGPFTIKKYVKATDALWRERTSELLHWMPPSVGTYQFESAEERMKKNGLDQYMDLMENMNLDAYL